MKRLIIVILAAALLLTLCACGKKSVALPTVPIPTTDPNAPTTQPTTPAETEPMVTPPNLHIYSTDTWGAVS